jgi:hypothetical protein
MVVSQRYVYYHTEEMDSLLVYQILQTFIMLLSFVFWNMLITKYVQMAATIFMQSEQYFSMLNYMSNGMILFSEEYLVKFYNKQIAKVIHSASSFLRDDPEARRGQVLSEEDIDRPIFKRWNAQADQN